MTAEDMDTYDGADHLLGGKKFLDIYIEVYMNPVIEPQTVFVLKSFEKEIP